MSERVVIPEACRKSGVCLREDGHDGTCQPKDRRDQREVRRILQTLSRGFA